MAYRLTLHQIPIEPVQAVERANRERDEHDQLDPTRLLPCVAGAVCQVVGLEYTSGGNPETGRWTLNVVVTEEIKESS